MNVTRDTLGIVYIKSDKDTHFTGATAQHAQETESISLSVGSLQNFNIRELVIVGTTIQAKQNHEFDIFLWSDDDFDNTDYDLDQFVDSINFPSANGDQIAATNQFYYPSPSNLAIPYKLDDPTTRQIHCSLVDRTAGGKSAGADGLIVITFMARPVFGI